VIDPKGDNWRSQLWRFAKEMKVEFLDMSAAWGGYVKDQDEPYESFMRDVHHANERGFMLLARIVEAFFAPK
jgi:hypothetical protein